MDQHKSQKQQTKHMPLGNLSETHLKLAEKTEHSWTAGVGPKCAYPLSKKPIGFSNQVSFQSKSVEG